MSLRDLLENAPEFAAWREVGSLEGLVARAVEDQAEVLKRIAVEFDRSAESPVEALRRQALVMNAVLIWGFATMAAYLEIQTGILTEMLRVSSEPQRTRARERQRDGVAAYKNGVSSRVGRWFDDALRDFAEAVDVDRYDFVSYWFIGLIQTFYRLDDAQAERAFAEAAHYAWPRNAEASAAALLAVAFVRYAGGRLEEAREAAGQAVERAPKLAVAHYHLSRYQAATGDCNGALDSAGTGISLDPQLFEAVAADPLLAACPGLTEWLDRMIAQATDDAHECCRRLDRLIAEAETVTSTWNPLYSSDLGPYRTRAGGLRMGITASSYAGTVETIPKSVDAVYRSVVQLTATCLEQALGVQRSQLHEAQQRLAEAKEPVFSEKTLLLLLDTYTALMFIGLLVSVFVAVQFALASSGTGFELLVQVLLLIAAGPFLVLLLGFVIIVIATWGTKEQAEREVQESRVRCESLESAVNTWRHRTIILSASSQA